MGCKFSFKRVFLVASLCLAGLFGISSVVINEQVKETPVVEKAEAAVVPPLYISIDHNCGWNLNGYDTWYTTNILFFSSDNLVNIYNTPTSSNASYIKTISNIHTRANSGSKDTSGDRFAVISAEEIPANAKSFVINNGNNNRSYPQSIPTDGLNLFYIDTNSGVFGDKWQSGYWTRYNENRVQNIYVDRNGSPYTDTTLVYKFYYRSDKVESSTNYTYYSLNDNNINIDFSSVCYGGIEYSDVFNINSITNYKKASYVDIYYFDNSTKKYTEITDEPILLPVSNVPLIYDIDEGTWSSSIPEKISLIVDVRTTESWYSNPSDIYNPSNQYPITVYYKNSSGGAVSNSTFSTITVDGVKYGKVTIPFNASTIYLFSDMPWGDNQYTFEYSIPTPTDGRKYVVFETTTDETAMGSGKQSGRFLNDPFRYTITYAGEAGTHSNPSSYVWGVGATLTNATRVGYTFQGYHYNSDYSDYDVTSISANDSGNITLYTEWTPIKYDITWQNYDGSEIKTDHVDYDSMPVYSGDTPTKPSSGSTFYEFNGWDPEVSTVSGDATYTAQFIQSSGKMRLYFDNGGWTIGGEHGRPFIGRMFGPLGQPEANESIAADPVRHIPASGTSVVANWNSVADVALEENGQTTMYASFFQDTARYIPWRNGQSCRADDGGMNNAVGLNDAFNQTFKNGYIYSMGITGHKAEWNDGTDVWDGEYRPKKWYTYSISEVGVFVHFDLNGGSHPSLANTDIEHKKDTALSLPSAPTKFGYTFMGWEASTNGILNRASTSFDVHEPMTFKAIWHSNTIPVVPSGKVRVWLGYNIHDDYISSLMYNGEGYSCKLWLHEGNGTAGEYEDVVSATGTFYNNSENLSGDYTSCPRRYDYYDVPEKYFNNGCYLTVQRFNPNGEWVAQTNNQMTLTASNNYSFKVIYVKNDGSTWYFDPTTQGYGVASTDALFASISLAGIHTCSDDLMNGYGGFSNWSSAFLQSTSVSDLANYTIVDFENGSDYSSDEDINKNVNAYQKYLEIQNQANPASRGISSLANTNWLINGQDGSNTSTIIIIVASSLSLLSITALSILLVKKRKSKEQ